MSRAMVAVAKSKISAVLAELRLEHDEIARIGAGLLFDAGRRSGLDRKGLHALLEDAIAAATIDEGRPRAGQ